MKKAIITVSTLLIIGVFAIKTTSYTTVNDLLGQNIEALANDVNPYETASDVCYQSLIIDVDWIGPSIPVI